MDSYWPIAIQAILPVVPSYCLNPNEDIVRFCKYNAKADPHVSIFDVITVILFISLKLIG